MEEKYDEAFNILIRLGEYDLAHEVLKAKEVKIGIQNLLQTHEREQSKSDKHAC